MTRIVVLGGGFAGVEAIGALHRRLGRRRDVDLLLVSDHNYLLFTPLLPQVASSLVETEREACPRRKDSSRDRLPPFWETHSGPRRRRS